MLSTLITHPDITSDITLLDNPKKLVQKPTQMIWYVICSFTTSSHDLCGDETYLPHHVDRIISLFIISEVIFISSQQIYE